MNITEGQLYYEHQLSEAAEKIRATGIEVGDIVKYKDYDDKELYIIVKEITFTDDECGVMAYVFGYLCDEQGNFIIKETEDYRYVGNIKQELQIESFYPTVEDDDSEDVCDYEIVGNIRKAY